MKHLDKQEGEVITFVEGKITPSTGSVGLETQLGGTATTVSAFSSIDGSQIIQSDVK